MASSFTIETTATAPFGLAVRRERTRALVTVRGELDLRTAPQLRVCLTNLPKGQSVDVDLEDVTFIDSTALGVLLAALKRCWSAGSDLRVVGASAFVDKVLNIAGLSGVLGTGDPRDAAAH